MAYITKKNGSITRIIHNNDIERSFTDIPVWEADGFIFKDPAGRLSVVCCCNTH